MMMDIRSPVDDDQRPPNEAQNYISVSRRLLLVSLTKRTVYVPKVQASSHRRGSQSHFSARHTPQPQRYFSLVRWLFTSLIPRGLCMYVYVYLTVFECVCVCVCVCVCCCCCVKKSFFAFLRSKFLFFFLEIMPKNYSNFL